MLKLFMVCVSVWKDNPFALTNELSLIQMQNPTIIAYCTSMHLPFVNCKIFHVIYVLFV